MTLRDLQLLSLKTMYSGLPLMNCEFSNKLSTFKIVWSAFSQHLVKKNVFEKIPANKLKLDLHVHFTLLVNIVNYGSSQYHCNLISVNMFLF